MEAIEGFSDRCGDVLDLVGFVEENATPSQIVKLIDIIPNQLE